MCATRALLALLALCGVRAGPGPPTARGALELRFASGLYNLSVPENSPPRTYARQPPAEEPLGVQLPAPDARVRFRIRHGDKDKFFKAEERTVGDFCFLSIRTRAGHADVLNRERRDSYRLDVRATATLGDGRALEADTVLAITVADENDLSPLFYPTEYEVAVPEDTALHASVARVSAEDADLGLNGEIYYSLAEPTDRFLVHLTSGVVTLTRELSADLAPRHRITVLAQDRAALRALGPRAPAAKASLTVNVLRANRHAPRMHPLPSPDEEGACAALEVTDEDTGEAGRVAAVDVVDGDPHGHFRVRGAPPRYVLQAHPLLSRAASRAYNVTLRALDAGRPPRASFLTLPVLIRAREQAPPVFSRELYEASVPETVPPGTPVIRLKVEERDQRRPARVYVEVVGGNEGDEFYLNPDTGVLYTAVPLDAEQKALYTLTVSAVDQGDAGTRKQSSAKVKITVLDANDNDPVFESEPGEVVLQENGPSGGVVARVSARDRDSGDNAYVSYSVANLRPVPFEVDHFTGVVRTTRLLDYETMRRQYTLRIRASDWGTPYRRQAETSLVVRLQDVNDNRPQFERVDCVGYLPRGLAIGSDIVTLSAIDFDAGDVVSYRIIGGNEDNCFALDASSGVLSLACDLTDVRAETRLLNVTATDGTHFADAAALSLHLAPGAAPGALQCRDTGVARRLTDQLAAAERSNSPLDPADEPAPAPSRYGQNLHAPEFLDFPVEVKVNESVALGTSLVKLKARDRDLGYNGLLVYGISGGDAHSAFRIEPDTGELQVIGYLDRERESEYYLNVTVYDLGSPQRSASRLLPVTVLDVNDNPPRFETSLASFRVSESALNGTVIFHANATDPDAGAFGLVTYSVSGAEEGEFCVERQTGVLRVCAPLDRERRALYELAVRARDGGGRWAEAHVRVALDDVNDNAPRFAPRLALGTYVARVREDVPRGSLVAVLDATDPDLGDGGRLLYSLPYEDADDAAFTVDPTSGTLRTAKLLDFEEKPGYSVTVRATDGGQPPLWAEVTVFVEVDDVDENQHTPTFAHAAVLAGAVREDAATGSLALLATASDADAPGRDSLLAYYIVAGSGMAHFSVDENGAIRTLTPLDREAVPHYWLTLCAQDHGLVPRHACVRVYVEVLDVNDEAPWPSRAAYAAEVAEHCAPGTHVATVFATDGDAATRPANLTYSIVAGNPDGLFSIDEATGEVVTTGRALDREAVAAHALEVRVSDGDLATTARLTVRVTDINDHAPAFAHRYTDVRVPADPPAVYDTPPDDDSAEWEGDDDDEGSAPRQPWDLFDEPAPDALYLATVIAFDGDEGNNGTVRYWGRARGAARGVLRVHARSGRVLLTRGVPPAPGRALELAVRACDMAPRPRCSVARMTVRGELRGGGRPPTLTAPPPLQVTELDSPGYLVTVLQASDPDGDPVYYDIVEGDPGHQFYMGREDGSLVLARRLLWEERAQYALNVSASDGLHAAYVTVNISVINDSFEEGVSFERDLFELEVSEGVRVGEALATLRARAHPAARLLYGVHAARAPSSHALFRLHERSGVLELASALDRESAAEHELTVWARDEAPRSTRAYARVLVRVQDADEHAPEWGRALVEARVGAGAAPGALVAALRAWDRDVGEAARVVYSLAGDGAAGQFAVDAALGDVRLARSLPAAPRSYTLTVRAANPAPGARGATLTLLVHVVEPDDAPPRFAAVELSCELYENEPGGTTLLALDVHSTTSLWFSLEGGAGLFRINPTAGLLFTVAPLDYETQNFYNLTVTAINMGGGRAVAHVGVHVLDRNEFPPELSRRTYRGRVSESAAPGALLMDADAPLDAPAPLVLHTHDADSLAHQQRAFEIVPPAAAALFRIDAITGALLVRAALDHETAARHEFTVRVIDMGSPRLPSVSVAEVVVEVIDVNDCPPQFSQDEYEATVLLPTWADVAVVTTAATDPDEPRGVALQYDIIEGDSERAFYVSSEGVLRVAVPALLRDTHRLRVRASDGRYASTARVHVHVRAADNSGLAFQKAEYYGSLVENSTKPTTILVVNVLGTALNEHVLFTILNPTEGFEVGPTSGAVRSSGVALDREVRAFYELVLEARSTTRVARARLHVALTDVNDNCPVFVHRPYVAAVRAGDEPGTPVINVEAVDADADDNGEVRYEMKRGNGELFRVDRRSGLLSLKQTLDTPDQLHALVVAAFDGGVPACGAEAEVTVRVWGGGAAPSWPRAHFALEVAEDEAPGAPLGAPLRASSPVGRSLIYTLLNDTEALFELHHETGVLVARGELDRERAPRHELLLRATDGETGAHADATLSLQVTDVNDCAPRFSRDLYRARLSEGAAPGHLLLRVLATDDDQGSNADISYSLSPLEGAPEEGEPPFAVDERTGDVTLSGVLDRERRAHYHLVVTATDGGAPPLRSSAHLFVEVEDVNDCAPRVERGVVAAPVSGEAAHGTWLARVAAWDPDAADAGRLRYALLGAAQRSFVLDERTGVLALGEAPPQSARSLNVSVSDGAHATFARIKLSPAPINSAPPHFPHVVHETRALEGQPPPLLLTTVKAYDEDAAEFGAVTYSIPSARLRDTFAVDAGSGAFTARVALDREARAHWDVPVLASDGGGLLRHSVVRVRVLDRNDCAPRFPLREYRAAVPHDAVPRRTFLTAAATDGDAPEHARITYSLHDDPAAPVGDLLHVEPATGALSLARVASHLAGREVRVWVRAYDDGGLHDEVALVLHVLRAGRPVPRLAAPPPALFLHEDAQPGTSLALLSPADSDAPPLRYRLVPADYPRDLFSVDDDGRLTLTGRLDRETAAEHVIGVIGEDAEGAASMVVTRLLVLDVNEHAPSFHSQPYVVHVAENTPLHTSLVQLMADDPDSGANGEVRFSLAQDESAEGAMFAIDAHTGWVTTLAPLDRELRAEHRLALLATDGGPERRVARGTLIVRVLDYNDCAPRFSSAEMSAEVREDAPAGTVLLRLELLDEDATAAPLSFFVVDGDPRARFQLRASGELLVARALDRELEPSYELTVAATDGKFTASAQVLVSVLDVNDNPPYCLRSRYSVQLSEDATNGTLVATLETGDADEPANTHLRYYLTGEDAHHFAIDKEGTVRVAARLDRERRAHYALAAHAQDRERAHWRCSSDLLVALLDVNDNAPLFSAATYSVTLPEDADVGTLVAKVHATDADLGHNRLVRYSLLDGSDNGDAFHLAPDSGIVTLRMPLDREAQAEHRLVVRANDGGEPALSSTATLRLTVADVNDNPPEFERREYHASVSELDAPGTEVVRVLAVSRDTGLNAVVYYSLVGGDDRDHFAVERDSGVLSVARALDYERRRAYLLTVQALDGGSPPLSDLATVNITITDGNDNAPRFSQPTYAARVREDAALGTRVLQLLAQDADSGGNGRVSYSITRGDRDSRFALDPDTGLLSVAAPLDREAVPLYTLEVHARDHGLPALDASARVTVELVDANDNPPLFAHSNYSAVVAEDRPLGHTVLKFLVEDADAPPNAAPYTFDFQSGNEMGAFRLEQDGYLRTATRFNHRIRDRYVLQVRVFDNGSPPLYSDAWVYIKVIEESQYPPVVTPLEVVVNSYLDEFPGGVIGRVIASDRDAYDSLTYSIGPTDGAPYPPTDLFEIDPSDGTLSAAPRLDVGEYHLNVTVDDGKFLGFATVKVTVLLVSDEMLAQAIVVRFREVTDRDFVLSHRKGFLRAVSEATDCEVADVIVLSVQPSGESAPREGRPRRQVAQDLDVAFCVRGESGPLPADALRRRLHQHLERLEERARLVVEELVRAACGGCEHGACIERVELHAEPRALSCDVFALVAPAHRLRARCSCERGYEGERCERAAPDCATCAFSPLVAHLRGDGYLQYRLERGAVDGARMPDDELTLSLRFRTRRERGTLLAVAGRVDYGVLEVAEGYLQFRMDLGAGPAAVRAAVPVSDGAWHTARLERRGASMRLTVDRRSAQAHTPPPAAVLDARADRLILGAVLQRHAHALAAEQVTYGFDGCLSELKLGALPLPLEEGGATSDGRVYLVRRVRVSVSATCPALAPPSPCSSYPCLHGGTCREPVPPPEGEGYVCMCHARFSGPQCELDSAPCASQPCLHGAPCTADERGYRCACPPGLAGERCERGRWCSPGVCAHGGACEEGEAGPSCRCRGYWGPRCQYDVDECAGEPCLNGATCLNEPGSFRCLCPPDKTGMNCGNPLYSDAVVAGGAADSTARAVRDAWRWACEARWPLMVAGAALLLLLLTAVLVPMAARRRRGRSRDKSGATSPLNSLAADKLAPRGSKLSNLEAVRRERPASCAEPPPLNNVDTLRSYGSAGDELEGIPPDYRRNLNIDVVDRKPWSEQMHLHTFVDNKIYNDLKGCKAQARRVPLEPAGVYHWDCSDWCGGAGALPGISEVAGSERPDSSSPASPGSPAASPAPLYTDSAPDEPRPAAPCYLACTDDYTSDAELRARTLREPDAASLITMLEERNSLLGCDDDGSGSELSANLCEIEESDAETEPARTPLAPRALAARHTDV